jgi:hypothetical protein
MLTVHQFAQLKLPERSTGEMMHLVSAAGFCLSASDAIASCALTPQHFPDAQDMDRAVRSNRLWMWEERPILNTDTPTLIRASSSLVHLLEHTPGAGPYQRQALEVLETFFPTYSLCFNDYLLSGYATAEEFLKKDNSPDAFRIDEAGLQKAIETNAIWTLVEQVSSVTHWGAADLETLLAQAFMQHPVLARHRSLEETLVSPTPRKTIPRF